MKIFVVLTLFILSSCTQEIDIIDIKNPSADKIKNGQELTQGLASCGYCHGVEANPSSPLAGGREFEDVYGKVKASNITPSESGIGNWTLTDFITALRENEKPDGKLLSIEFHKGYAWASDKDLSDIFSYLQSLEPVDHVVAARELSFWKRNTVGLLEDRSDFSGFVPQIKSREKIKQGAYIVDHVANCTRCHSDKGGFLKDAEYLGGGKVVTVDGIDRQAPSLTNYGLSGIGSWSQQQLVDYLLTGETAEGLYSDKRFCPIEFYRLANPDDLKAVASYLKSID